jgi:hypothetical protein
MDYESRLIIKRGKNCGLRAVGRPRDEIGLWNVVYGQEYSALESLDEERALMDPSGPGKRLLAAKHAETLGE